MLLSITILFGSRPVIDLNNSVSVKRLMVALWIFDVLEMNIILGSEALGA